MTHSRRSWLAGAALLTFTCLTGQAQEAPRSAANDPKAQTPTAASFRQPRQLMPLKAGVSLHYRLALTKREASEAAPDESGAKAIPDKQNLLKNHKLVVKQLPDQEVGGRLLKVLAYYVDGELSQQELLSFEAAGLRCHSRVYGPEKHSRSFRLEGSQLVLKNDLSLGESWAWKGKVGSINARSTVTAEGIEPVEAAGQTYRALKVTTTFDGEDDSHGRSTRWYHPGLGVVKEVTEVTTNTESFVTTAVLSKVVTKPPAQER
jgi:hypothetical protein